MREPPSAVATCERGDRCEWIIAGILVTVLDRGKPSGWPRRKATGRFREEAAVSLKG
jgi:hypothetical protein